MERGGRGRIKESLMIVSSLKNNCSSIHGCTVSSITREILKKEIFQFRNFKGHISFFLRSKDRFPSEKIDEVYFSIFSPPAESHKFPFSLSFPHIVKIAYIYIYIEFSTILTNIFFFIISILYIPYENCFVNSRYR